MADSAPPSASSHRSDSRRSDGGAVVLASAVAGAMVGAAGLAWWLLHKAERRQQQHRLQRLQRLSRQLETGLDSDDRVPLGPGLARDSSQQQHLHDRVHQLNQAIEDVRRQLENLRSEA